ncbi:MAG: hypothetical protein CMM52_02685 [Rhodospirillaceae bacterium]|nr:hypothetical protein [Rhodospirillaceae bacterium]
MNSVDIKNQVANGIFIYELQVQSSFQVVASFGLFNIGLRTAERIPCGEVCIAVLRDQTDF